MFGMRQWAIIGGPAAGMESRGKQREAGCLLLSAPCLLLTSHCSCEKPQNPFVSVCYEGYWFWIEKNDFRSKRTLAYFLVLLALADTGPKEGLPVITIQAN